MAFGKEIKRLREEAGISAQKLAERLGVDAVRYRKWEQTDASPRHEDLVRIEAYFKMTVAEVMKLKSIKNFLIVPHGTGTVLNQEKENWYQGTSFAVPKIVEQLLKEREATMEQMEARRMEAQERLARAEAEKDRLYKIIEDNMTAMLVSLNQNQSHLLDARQLLSDVIAPQVTAHRKALETLLAGEKKSEKISASKSGKGLGGRTKHRDGKGSSD